MINNWLKPAYLPTPDEIERECEAIQQCWSERERLRRLLYVTSDAKDYASNEVDMVETEPIEVLPSRSKRLTKRTKVRETVSRVKQPTVHTTPHEYRLHADCF
jgi:hypothetical protein